MSGWRRCSTDARFDERAGRLGALAPYWQLFEALGSDASVGEAAVSDGAGSPLLYIGAGLGTYPAALAKRVGTVVAIDRSIAMARRANAHLPTIVADVRALPFADATFRGVFCATGVMELLGGSISAAYTELARVARGAPIHVAAFIDTGIAIDRHALIAAWLAGHAHDELLDRLAGEVGDRQLAGDLVTRAMSRYAVGIAERTIIDAAATASLSTRRLLRDRGCMLWRHE